MIETKKVSKKLPRAFREQFPDVVRNILRQRPVPIDQPQRRAMHKTDVSGDQFPKRLFRAGFRIFCKQLTVCCHFSLLKRRPPALYDNYFCHASTGASRLPLGRDGALRRPRPRGSGRNERGEAYAAPGLESRLQPVGRPKKERR